MRTPGRRRLYPALCMVAGFLVVGGTVWVASHGAATNPQGLAAAPTLRTTPVAHQVHRHAASATTAPPPATTSSTTTTTDPGTLPQTSQFPTTTTPQFSGEMAAFWQGVVTGSAKPAMPAFFPESAYEQLKSIGDPGGDYTNRLVADYQLDLAAARAQLGPGAASAQLVGVQVPAANGHWVGPGVCANSVGYFEVPDSRVVYSEGGQVLSFGIASMISWRGEWYVVHLGAIVRSGSGGVVDDPETGPGTSRPSSTC